GAAPVLTYDYLKDPNNAFEMVYNGSNSGDGYMLEIAGVGDIDGDGRDDFGIGVKDLNGAATGDGGLILVHGRSRPAEITTGNEATANGQSLIGGAGVNLMSDGNRSDVSIRTGAGNDTINISNANFRNIDGGGGFDTVKVNQNLDFSNI